MTLWLRRTPSCLRPCVRSRRGTGGSSSGCETPLRCTPNRRRHGSAEAACSPCWWRCVARSGQSTSTRSRRADWLHRDHIGRRPDNPARVIAPGRERQHRAGFPEANPSVDLGALALRARDRGVPEVLKVAVTGRFNEAVVVLLRQRLQSHRLPTRLTARTKLAVLTLDTASKGPSEHMRGRSGGGSPQCPTLTPAVALIPRAHWVVKHDEPVPQHLILDCAVAPETSAWGRACETRSRDHRRGVVVDGVAVISHDLSTRDSFDLGDTITGMRG